MTRKELLRHLMRTAGLSYVATAELIHRSPHTVHAWLKPDTSRSANNVPLDAIELLALKTGTRLPAGWDKAQDIR